MRRLPIPRALEAKLRAAHEEGRAALVRVKTIARVGKKTGMHEGMTLRGARLLASAVAKGKQNASLIFRFHAENTPHKIGLIAPQLGERRAERAEPAGPEQEPQGGDRAFSFFELDERIDQIGAALAARGMGPGSAALLTLKNRPEFILIQAAIGRLGGSAITASWRSTAGELAYLTSHSGAKIVFFDADVTATITELRASGALDPAVELVCVGGRAAGLSALDDLIAQRSQVGQDDPGPRRAAPPDQSELGAVVMYTSGTTGKPKGAVRRFQKNALASALAFIGETPMRVGEVHLVACPLYHATAFGFVGLSYALGSTLVVPREFHPERFLELVERYKITTTALVPTMLHRIVELGPDVIRKYDTSSLKAMFSGGAQLSAPLAHSVLELLGDTLFNFYGSTETGIVTVAGPDDLRASPGTIGRPVPGVEIRLLDDEGREVPQGSAGELYVRSAMLIDGYHADEEGTRASMRDGFFSVGDVARLDKRGCYHIEGRKRDMIISGGVNIYPAEVEAAIDAHPSVLESAVVGAPDREWGERAFAFVVAKRGASITEDELRVHCKARLAGPKVPRAFVVLDALPKNPTGKTLKHELRRMSRDPSLG